MASIHTRGSDPRDCSRVGPGCTVENSIYGYYPNLAVNAFFTALFALLFIVNVYLGWRFRTWTYMLAMTLACLAAAVGYGGRVKLHENPYDNIGFQIQICCLTLSPAFNSAAVYLCLKHIIRKFGLECSRLQPRYYTWIFITADILALILQAAGGGLAATSGDNFDQLKTGDNLMITGIAWQVLTLLVFGIMTVDYIVQRWRSPTRLTPLAKSTTTDPKFQIFAVALVITYLAILLRCVYRIVEMTGGWQNSIMQDQGLFIGADSCMVALATLLQTLIHPGYFFPALGEATSLKNEKTVVDSSEEDLV